MRAISLSIIGLVWVLSGAIFHSGVERIIMLSSGMIINALGLVCGAIESKKEK